MKVTEKSSDVDIRRGLASTGLTGLSRVLCTSQTSLVAQMVKRLSTMRETWVRSLGGEDLLEKEMTTYSCGSQRIGHN